MTETQGRFVGHGLPTDTKLLAALGAVSLRHAQLDNALRMLIGDLASVTKAEALDATMRDGSRELRERSRKLAKERLGECASLVKLQALLQRASRLSQKRNELTHSVWGTELDGDVLMRDEDHTFKLAPTVGEIELIVQNIEELLEDIIVARKNGFLKQALATKTRRNRAKGHTASRTKE